VYAPRFNLCCSQSRATMPPLSPTAMEGKAKPGFPSLFSDTLDKAVDKKIKGSNGRCDPTVRAL